MQIPSLENVQVDNLPDECREPWDLMIRQWSQKLERNLLRTKYYDGRNELKNLSIAVPDSMAGISEVVGWPQKSVDALADRIVFDGFVGVGDDSRDPLGLDSILSDNDFDVELPQAIRSALTHSCSFLNVRSAEPEDGLRSKVSVSFRSALYETGLWDYARRGLSAALSITDIDRSQYAQANTIVPSELMLYMPGYTIRIRRTQSGRYHADAPRNTYMDHVPVYLIPYHQDLNRPFGRSRISREVMSITDTAVRTMLRMEVSAEFYSSPQRYLIGADEPPEDKNGKKLTGWEATISKMLNISLNEDGQAPAIGQFTQMTMQPHTDMLRALAARMSGATGVPLSQFGVMTDSGPSSSEAIMAAESELVIEAKNACRAIGVQLRKAARDIAILNGTSEDSDELDRLQVNWRDPERPSQAALSDAIVKQVTAMPWLANSDVILEKLGYTDSDITRLLVDKRKAETRSVLDSLVNGGNKDDGQPATGPAASQPSQSGGTGAPRSGETVGGRCNSSVLNGNVTCCSTTCRNWSPNTATSRHRPPTNGICASVANRCPNHGSTTCPTRFPATASTRRYAGRPATCGPTRRPCRRILSVRCNAGSCIRGAKPSPACASTTRPNPGTRACREARRRARSARCSARAAGCTAARRPQNTPKARSACFTTTATAR